MPGMMCRCGDKLSWGDIPNPCEWKFLSDPEFEQFTGEVNAEQIYLAMSSFLRCRSCGRLWVFWDGFGAEPQEYVPALANGGDRERG